MIVLAPGYPLWHLVNHAPWLTWWVIRATKGSAVLTAVLLLVVWFRRAGLRCALSAGLGLVGVVAAAKGIHDLFFVTRPFVEYRFTPLYAHAENSAFPSTTTAYVAAVAAPVLCAWRRLGWIGIALTCEVAFGCVYVGVHYVVDVLAGAALGGLTGYVGWLLLGLSPMRAALGVADRALGALRLRPRPGTSPRSRSRRRLMAQS